MSSLPVGLQFRLSTTTKNPSQNGSQATKRPILSNEEAVFNIRDRFTAEAVNGEH